MEYDCLAYNPKWRVLPSIAFFKGKGPQLLTCRHHDGGTHLKYLHLPSTISTTVPSPRPNQLSPAVVRPRTLSKMKVANKKYNTGYQTSRMVGSYNGIDTFDLCEVHDFKVQSDLLDLQEATAIAGRQDIHSVIAKMVAQGKMSEGLACQLRERPEQLGISAEMLDQRSSGATFLTLLDCMNLQNRISVGYEKTISDGHQGDRETFRPPWQKRIIWLHTYDNHGARFHDIPKCTTRRHLDTRLLWFSTSIISTLQEVWASLEATVCGGNDVEGWLLSFCAREMGGMFKNGSPAPRGSNKGLYCLNAPRNHTLADAYASKIWELVQHNESSPPEHYDSTQLTKMLGHATNILTVDNPTSMECLCNAVVHETVPDHSNVSVLVAARSFSAGGRTPPMTVLPSSFTSTSGRDFELRYVGTTNCSQSSTWKATAYVRHASQQFPSWWRQERLGTMEKVPECEPHETTIDWNNWDCAVFVSAKPISTDQIRLQYLHYIGGQSRFFCAVHSVPMVYSSSSDKERKREFCCANVLREVSGDVELQPCQSTPSFFECPLKGCANFVCKNCYCGDPSDHIDIFPLEEQPHTATTDNPLLHSVVDVPESANPHQEGDNDDAASACGSTPPAALDDFTVAVEGMVREEDVLQEDEELDDVSFNYGDDTEPPEATIPTTSASAGPIHVQRLHKGTDFIPGRIMMCNCCSLLVRQNDTLRGNRLQQSFLQRLVSSSSGDCVPLVFPEAMLFPSIFPRSIDVNGPTVLGAIPSGLLAQSKTVHSAGFATMREHAQVRLTAPNSLAMSCPFYLNHMFDCCSNMAMNGRDSRLVMQRGFGVHASEGGPSAMALRGDEDEEGFLSSAHSTDHLDRRHLVNGLNAADKEDNFTLFYSLSVNTRDQFGLRNILEWIRGNVSHILRNMKSQSLVSLNHFDNLQSKMEIAEQLHQLIAPILLRQWMEVKEILLKYIEHSPEAPFGHVTNIMGRGEYQDKPGAPGNLCHLHILMATVEKLNTGEGKAFLCNLIRGSADDLIREDEVQGLIDEGLLKDRDEWFAVKEQATELLTHKCNPRCQRKVGAGPDDTVCRVPNNYISSPDPTSHCFVPTHEQHSSEALSILHKLGLIEEPTVDSLDGYLRKKEYKPRVQNLKNLRHIPPTKARSGKFSPCNGRMFAATRSNQNLQIVSRKWVNSYLIKYCVQKDQSNAVFLKADPKTRDLYYAESKFLHNTKISSSARHEQSSIMKSRHAGFPQGRVVSHFEMMQLILGYPEIHTNIELLKITTAPLELRGGMRRSRVPANRIPAPGGGTSVSIPDIAEAAVPAYEGRIGLPSYRRPTSSQMLLAKDSFFSPVSLDKVTLFGLRPPELHFVDRLHDYYTCFIRDSKCELDTAEKYVTALHGQEMETTPWYDCLGHRVRLRAAAWQRLGQILQHSRQENELPLRLFTLIQDMCTDLQRIKASTTGVGSGVSADRISMMKKQFLHVPNGDTLTQNLAKRRLPTVFFPPVKAETGHKFILHFLLTRGRFVTEMDLLKTPCIVESMIKGKILPVGARSSETTMLEQAVEKLTRSYIEHDLAFCCLTATKFSNEVVHTWALMHDVILHNKIPIHELPPCLYTATRSRCVEQLETFIIQQKRKLAVAAIKEVRSIKDHTSAFPSVDDVMLASKSTPHRWDGTWSKTPEQSEASYNEQLYASRLLRHSLDTYRSSQPYMVNNCGVAGSPGAGKSFVMMVSALYCLCKGLLGITTSILACRSLVLGGIHFHVLFKIPFTANNTTPQKIAELAVLNILRNPTSYALLCRLDVIFLDEAGQVSAEQLAIMDIILRRVRGRTSFLGGVLLIATLDDKQLLNINGYPFLMSPHILACFKFARLSHSVRSGADSAWSRVQNITRLSRRELVNNPGVIREFKDIIINRCTHVSTWESKSFIAAALSSSSASGIVNSEKHFPAKGCVRGLHPPTTLLNPSSLARLHTIVNM